MDVKEWIQALSIAIRSKLHSLSYRPGWSALSRTEPMILTPKQYKRAILIASIGIVVIVAAVGIGVYQYISLQQMRAQEALHQQQLDIMREKRHPSKTKSIKWMPSTKSCGKWSKAQEVVTAQKVMVAQRASRRNRQTFLMLDTMTCF